MTETDSCPRQLGRCVCNIYRDKRHLVLTATGMALWLVGAYAMYATDVFPRYWLALMFLLAIVIAVVWLVAFIMCVASAIKNNKCCKCYDGFMSSPLGEFEIVCFLICYLIGCGIAYMISLKNNYEFVESNIAFTLLGGVLMSTAPLLTILVIVIPIQWCVKRYREASVYTTVTDTSDTPMPTLTTATAPEAGMA